jgi:hypothetical protein
MTPKAKLKKLYKIRKVKVSLYLINYASRHEDLRGSECITPQFLTSTLDGSEWSASRPGKFSPGERDPTGWVGPRAVLDGKEKRKISCPCLENKHHDSI